MHFTATLTSVTRASRITRVIIDLPKEKVQLADPRAEIYKAGDTLPSGKKVGDRKPAGYNKEASIELHFVGAAQGDVDGTGDIAVGQPVVHKIERADGQLRPVTAATFDVLITLSEEPKKDGFKEDHIDVANATAGDPIFLDMIDEIDSRTDEAADPGDDDTMPSSGRDSTLYRSIVTLTPKYENKDDIVVKVKAFYDQEMQSLQMYMPPSQNAAYTEGMDKLTVKVGKEAPPAKTAGIEVKLLNEGIIPKDGYLVVHPNPNPKPLLLFRLPKPKTS